MILLHFITSFLTIIPLAILILKKIIVNSIKFNDIITFNNLFIKLSIIPLAILIFLKS